MKVLATVATHVKESRVIGSRSGFQVEIYNQNYIINLL